MRLNHFLLALIVFALSTLAEAQQPGKIPRIGVLQATNAPFQREALLQGLRELGYAEGKNIAIEYRSADGQLERLPGLAAELVRLKVDVIVAASNPAIIELIINLKTAKQIGVTIPQSVLSQVDKVIK